MESEEILCSDEEALMLADRNVFVAEKIIRKRRSKTGVFEYFIKWQGWPHKYNTWEPEYNILDDSLVKSFARRNGKSLCRKRPRRVNMSGKMRRWQSKHHSTSESASGSASPKGSKTTAVLARAAADSQYVKNVSICVLECHDGSAGNIFDNVLWSLEPSSKRRGANKPSSKGSTEVEVDRVKVKIVEIPVEKCEVQVATDHGPSDSTWTGYNSPLDCSCPLSPLVHSQNVQGTQVEHASLDGSLFEMLDLQYLRAPLCNPRNVTNGTNAMALKVTSVMSVANTLYA